MRYLLPILAVTLGGAGLVVMLVWLPFFIKFWWMKWFAAVAFALLLGGVIVMIRQAVPEEQVR